MRSPEAGTVPVWAHEAVEIVSADPRWPELAAAEIARLERVLGPRLMAGIHHVGSTSVPGLEAKPILDLLAGIRDHAPDPDPETTRAYAALKHELAERHRTDREAYTRAKASFIEGVLARHPPSMER